MEEISVVEELKEVQMIVDAAKEAGNVPVSGVVAISLLILSLFVVKFLLRKYK